MKDYYVAWWNLENLFDVEDSPQRPDWLKARLKEELRGWDQATLDKKISQLSHIIRKMNAGKGPDLLGVCEVENKPVLEQLANSLSGLGRSYRIAHHDTSDQRGIDVAFIYDGDKLEAREQFFYTVLKRSGTRDLVQVNFRCESGLELIVIGNHWPSRSGGELTTEPYRIIAAETLSYWLERIQEIKTADAAVLVMGDFNDEPHSRSLTQYALSTNNVTKVNNAKAPRLYNLMWPLMGEGQGTFYFDNFALMLDQFLVSKGILQQNAPIRVKADSVTVEAFPEMTSQRDYPTPVRFGRSSTTLNLQGFSDHFPISLIVEEV